MAAEHTADMEAALNQDHDSNEPRFEATTNPNGQGYLLPIIPDDGLDNLGDAHPNLLDTPCLEDQHSNQSNSADSFLDTELEGPEISMETQPAAILDSLSIPFDPEFFWPIGGPAATPHTDDLCQGFSDKGLNAESPIYSVHTVSTADDAISGALLEEL